MAPPLAVGLALAGLAACAQASAPAGFAPLQQVFAAEGSRNGFPRGDEKTYLIEKPLKTVAVIGAGATGLIVANELLAHNYSVRVFERDDLPGGVWHYTDEVALPPHYNQTDVLYHDFIPDIPPPLPFVAYSRTGYSTARREHRAPKHVWRDLHSNAPTPLQQITAWPWPAGQIWKGSQWAISKYLRSYAAWTELASEEDYIGSGRPQVASYSTRVEKAEKVDDQWTLTLRRVTRHGADGYKTEWWQESFDGLVVATGRYNAPDVPKTQGLGEWGRTWPDKVFHSRNYRKPEGFANKTVLVVGVSISASEISRELANHAGKIYQSVRIQPHNNDTNKFPTFDRKYQLTRLPKEAELIPEVERYERDGNDISKGRVVLKNGTVLTGIDAVIFGSGYKYTFPYLPQLHNSTLKANEFEAEVPPIITDGTHLRSLYLDIFYIPDPTLAIVNLNRLVGDFTFGAYQATAVAKYWKRQIALPSKADQWSLHYDRVRERGGYTPTFQFYGPLAGNAYRYFIAWLNSAAVTYGGKQVDQLPVYRSEIATYFSLVNWGNDLLQDGSHPEWGDRLVPEQLVEEEGDHEAYDW